MFHISQQIFLNEEAASKAPRENVFITTQGSSLVNLSAGQRLPQGWRVRLYQTGRRRTHLQRPVCKALILRLPLLPEIIYPTACGLGVLFALPDRGDDQHDGCHEEGQHVENCLRDGDDVFWNIKF